MPILNYTTSIDVAKTLGEINRLLSSHGARRIVTDYDKQGNPNALEFLIETAIGPRYFRLPANADGVWRVLTRQQQSGKVQPRFATKEQAARVAFRILKDWLEAQVAIIEAGMVTVDEILLPYMLMDTDRTVYEEFKESRLALPARNAEGR